MYYCINHTGIFSSLQKQCPKAFTQIGLINAMLSSFCFNLTSQQPRPIDSYSRYMVMIPSPMKSAVEGLNACVMATTTLKTKRGQVAQWSWT